MDIYVHNCLLAYWEAAGVFGRWRETPICSYCHLVGSCSASVSVGDGPLSLRVTTTAVIL
jgi:hypothetical protein